MTTLKTDHPAVVNHTTMYRKNVHNPVDYKYKFIKPDTGSKLGKVVNVGRWRGHKFYTLTLEERATCYSGCEHYTDCFGNNMPFAHRFQTKTTVQQTILMSRMSKELNDLDRKHKLGYVVRTHILGDFFNVKYVKWWGKQLKNRPALKVYGYSRWHPDTAIGKALDELRTQYPESFCVRFSNRPDDLLSANSEHVSSEGVVCPEQTGKSKSCGDCGLCWTMKKQIIFLDH